MVSKRSRKQSKNPAQNESIKKKRKGNDNASIVDDKENIDPNKEDSPPVKTGSWSDAETLDLIINAIEEQWFT